jgi:phosphoglycolate phosphatase
MLERRGISRMDADRYREIFDFPVEQYYRRAGFDLDTEPFSILADEFIGEYNRRVGECTLHRDVPDLIERLEKRGVLQAVLSASRASTLHDAIAMYGIEDRFHSISGLDNHFAVSKIDVGKRLIESLPVQQDEIVMVGDTIHDAEVAEALGITPILVAQGHHSAVRLHQTGGIVLDNLSELFDPR